MLQSHFNAPTTAVAKPASATPLKPFTPVPNDFIDKLMPTLKDTEWRLLCVVTRQTLGWQAGPGRRKQRDWLTQRQLIARTGRHSAAISAALDILVRRHLIVAYATDGELLLTPQQRQRYKGRISYGLGERQSQNTLQTTKVELQKANTTKATEDKIKIYKGSAEDQRQFSRRQSGQGDQQSLVLYTGWTRAASIAATHLTAVSHLTAATEPDAPVSPAPKQNQ